MAEPRSSTEINISLARGSKGVALNKDLHFWATVLARGFVALLAGAGILIVSDMARLILLMPIALAVAIVGLAAYGVMDSTLVFVSSFMSDSEKAKLAMRLQGVIGVVVGVLLLSVSERVRLEWFLTLAAIQAFGAGIAEIMVARHSANRSLSLWNYAAAGIALIFSCIYVFLRVGWADRLTAHALSLSLWAYLVAFGIAQCITAARMLYADERAIIPS
jgi:hypothetical protein